MARRFEEAVAAYKKQLQGNSKEKWSNLAGLAESLMGAGHYGEAIPLLQEVSDHRTGDLAGSAGRREQISVCHWMIGDRHGALKLVRQLVLDVRNGTVTFTDFSGGVSQGLILCYMGITLRSIPDVDLAMNYLKGLATKPRIKNWPGPAALFLLGGLTFGDAIKNANDSAEERSTNQEGWKRRYLTPLLFAAGTERRMAGDEEGARRFFAECASLTNPLVEYEWYLAKAEASS